MKLRELIKEIENNYAVEDIKISRWGKTFQIYPWVKGRLFIASTLSDDLHLKKSFGIYWKQFKSMFYGWWNVFRKYETWIFTNSSERRLIDGKYTDKLFDYYAANSGRKSLLIETKFPKGYSRRKVASKYVMSKSILFFLETIYTKLFLRNVKIDNIEELNKIKERLGISDVDLSYNYKKCLAQYKVMKLWLFLFPKPKEVLLSVGYTNFGYIHAFKEARIPVIEFQHGLINENHQGYTYFKEFSEYYFPDKLMTFGKVEVSHIKNSKINFKNGVFSLGNFILANKIDSFKNVIHDESRIKVAVTLQDGILSEKIIEHLNGLKYSRAKFYLKPRNTPVEYYNSKFNFNENVCIVDNIDTYDLILSCDFHLTVYSTCAVESLVLGRPTIFYNIKGLSIEHFYEMLPPSKFVHYIENNDELIKLLEICPNNINPKLIQEEFSYLVDNNYKASIRTFVDTLAT